MAKQKQDNNTVVQFVGLAAVILGIFVAIAFGILIFSPEYTTEITPIAWAFSILGMVIAFFMYKTAKR